MSWLKVHVRWLWGISWMSSRYGDNVHVFPLPWSSIYKCQNGSMVCHDNIELCDSLPAVWFQWCQLPGTSTRLDNIYGGNPCKYQFINNLNQVNYELHSISMLAYCILFLGQWVFAVILHRMWCEVVIHVANVDWGKLVWHQYLAHFLHHFQRCS